MHPCNRRIWRLRQEDLKVQAVLGNTVSSLPVWAVYVARPVSKKKKEKGREENRKKHRRREGGKSVTTLGRLQRMPLSGIKYSWADGRGVGTRGSIPGAGTWQRLTHAEAKSILPCSILSTGIYFMYHRL
jgi:hypothetical protein